MKLLDAIARRFPAPRLTVKRIVLAFTVALAADAMQLALLPLGPIGLLPDEAIDVVAMGLTCWLLGFHVLLLPTFVLELVPVLGLLPTWTGCVAAVVALRKREQTNETAPVEVSPAPIGIPTPQLPPAGPPRLSEPSPGPAEAQWGERPRDPARLSEPSSGPTDGVDANPS